MIIPLLLPSYSAGREISLMVARLGNRHIRVDEGGLAGNGRELQKEIDLFFGEGAF